MKRKTSDFINSFRQSSVTKVGCRVLNDGEYVAHFREPYYIGKVIQQNMSHYSIEILVSSILERGLPDYMDSDILDELYLLDPNRFSIMQKTQLA